MDKGNAMKMFVIVFAMILAAAGIAFGAVGCSNHPDSEHGGAGYAVILGVCAVILLGCIDPIRKLFGYDGSIFPD